MNELPQGIFNPYAPPKKKKPQIQALDKRKTESGVIVEPSVTFDGDSYRLKFEGINNIDQAKERLTHLLHEVSKEHGVMLSTNGITVMEGNPTPPQADEMSLKGPKFSIIVYVGEPPHTEDMAYRRIAYTLKKLSVPRILAKYKATVNERG